jgi:hypothetical protein
MSVRSRIMQVGPVMESDGYTWPGLPEMVLKSDYAALEAENARLVEHVRFSAHRLRQLGHEEAADMLDCFVGGEGK